MKTELEDERTLQDRAVEQLQRKVTGGSRLSIMKETSLFFTLHPSGQVADMFYALIPCIMTNSHTPEEVVLWHCKSSVLMGILR